jgi:acyl phosphate:glycerol-3-phosphate acyltransferase
MTFEQIFIFLVMPLIGYLLGSVPFAWVIGKSKGVDIRTVGSKNIGATNLGRTVGPKYFWYAFLLDAAKGFLPILISSLFVRQWNAMSAAGVTPASWTFFTASSSSQIPPATFLPHWAPLLTGIACVVGHLFPLYLKFKGGKGVATGFGVVLGFWPLYTIAGVLAGLFFVFMLLIYRYISLASMTAATAFALFVAALGSWQNLWVETYLAPRDRVPLILVACLFAGLIVFRHRANLSRLMKGTEPKVGQREVDKARMDK